MTGGELRSRREHLYLSQAGLATRLGVAPNTVARWERNERALPQWVHWAMRGLTADIEEKRRSMPPEERHQENNRLERWFRGREAARES